MSFPLEIVFILEEERETSLYEILVASHIPLARDLAHNPGLSQTPSL